MANLSEEQVENAAEKLRRYLNLTNVAAPCMHSVLVKLQEKLSRFSFHAALASELGSAEAFMDEQAHKLTVRDSVLEEARAGRARARFTLAHELGHYFLGHEGARRRTANKALYGTSAERVAEREADIFASYFLVPTKLAAGLSTPDEIAEVFQMSMPVAEIAFERIQRIGRRAAGQRRQPPAVVIDFLKEAQKHGYKVKSDISEFDRYMRSRMRLFWEEVAILEGRADEGCWTERFGDERSVRRHET